jgi:DNA-binding NarL/FixJ family response regulator
MKSAAEAVRVVVVDDQELFRRGLTMLLGVEPDIEVVGEAGDGNSAIELVLETVPDVVLLDVRMPGMDGLEAARRILAADLPTRVIVLTTFDEDEYVAAALRAGVSGFLLKVAPPEQLLHAVRTVAAGNGLLDPAVTLRVIAASAAAPAPDPAAAARLASLTQRETDVLRLVAEGLTNAEIAGRLYLGEATVKTYLSRMLTKLDLRDRVQAVAFAFRSGLVPLQPTDS